VEQHRLDISCFLSIVFVKRARQTAVFSFIGSIPYTFEIPENIIFFRSKCGASHLAGFCGCVHFLAVFRAFYSVLEQILSFDTNPCLSGRSPNMTFKNFPKRSVPEVIKIWS